FLSFFFSFHAPAPTDLYTLSLHDALPISAPVARAVLHPTRPRRRARLLRRRRSGTRRRRPGRASDPHPRRRPRRRESQRGGARGSSAGAERGGGLARSERFLHQIRSELAGLRPDAELRPARGTSLDGALELAGRAA